MRSRRCSCSVGFMVTVPLARCWVPGLTTVVMFAPGIGTVVNWPWGRAPGTYRAGSGRRCSPFWPNCWSMRTIVSLLLKMFLKLEKIVCGSKSVRDIVRGIGNRNLAVDVFHVLRSGGRDICHLCAGSRAGVHLGHGVRRVCRANCHRRELSRRRRSSGPDCEKSPFSL